MGTNNSSFPPARPSLVLSRLTTASQIQVPLDTANPTHSEHHLPSLSTDETDADPLSLLPLAHLTPHTLLGGADSVRETTGQLVATQVASAVAAKDAADTRTVLVGLGLQRPTLSGDDAPDGEEGQAAWLDLVELVGSCL